jgi:uncharacterized protein
VPRRRDFISKHNPHNGSTAASHRSAAVCISVAGFWLLAAIFGAAGCRKKQTGRLTSSQVHAITRQMVHAISSELPARARVETQLEFDAGHLGRADRIRITLAPGPSPEFMNAAVQRLTQSLDAVAAANSLAGSASSPTATMWELQYRRAGVLTHVVQIHSTEVASRGLSARLAIILDDLGNDRSVAESIFALPYPVTISILPNHSHSAEIAEEAHQRGLGVMLHLPMQSLANEKPEAQELRPGMSQENVTSLVNQLLASVPHVSGVNNHQGSQSTADAALMSELMPVLREHKLFYVDSRTTAATVAFDTAEHDGVRAAFRNVPFLDDVVEISAIRKQLRLALNGAAKKGEAIAIGHPHAATLAALRDLKAQAESSGVQLVPAADLVH